MTDRIRWITAFLDFAPDHVDQGGAFWSALTGYDASAPRGEAGEFATLQPPSGDAFLRVQRLGQGADGVHLDLHVTDPRAATDRAVRLGAEEVDDLGDVVMLRSPGGFTFCFVGGDESVPPPPSRWPNGHASLLDQVCLDIPEPGFEVECDFWSALTGWERRASSVAAEFGSLVRPAGQPVRLLFQQLDELSGDVRAHLDWATTDRPAEVARHLALGARLESTYEVWTVLVDPVGRRYCITDRHPETQVLEPPVDR